MSPRDLWYRYPSVVVQESPLHTPAFRTGDVLKRKAVTEGGIKITIFINQSGGLLSMVT